MFIRKKTFILIVTYLSAAVIALGAYTAAHFGMERDYRRTAEYGYEHAFEEVVTAAAGLSEALHRASYATGAELSGELCADIYGRSLAAGMTMAALPFSTQELEQTAAFVGIAGDYARSLLRTCAEVGFGDPERENFAALHKTAAQLTEKLQALQGDVNDGTVLMDEPENIFAGSGSTVSAAMLEIEDGITATSLGDYGGRYANFAPNQNKAPLARDEARVIAADFFGLDPEQLEVEYTAENGTQCLAFDGGSICVDADGHVMSLTSGRAVVGELDSAELEQLGRDFLTARGFGEMRLAESERLGGVQVMKFECVQNGVRCMGDYVKLSIAGDDGTVYAYDASAHIARHGTFAQSPTAAVSQAQAMGALPGTLTVCESELCYAQDDAGNGVLCYCFDCLGLDGEPVRVLVDASTAHQFAVF